MNNTKPQQQNDSLLDYRFGWRWLLPLQAIRCIFLHGFDEAESRYLQLIVLPATITHIPESADCWIINAEAVDSLPLLSSSIENVSTVCVIGRNSLISRWRIFLRKKIFIDIHEYGLLPHVNPRILIPLGSPLLAAQALTLHRPGRRIVQLGVQLARFLAFAGIYAPLRRRVLLIANKKPELVPMGALQSRMTEFISKRVLDYAIYLGTIDNNRKTVVLPLGDGTPDTIMKVGSSSLARKSLLNEYRTLSDLFKTPLRSNLPLVKGIVDDESGVTLYQEYRARIPQKKGNLKSSIIELLSKLSHIDRRVLTLNDYLKSRVDMDSVSEHTKRWLVSRAQIGVTVCEYRGHGDFAPWNIFWTGRGLFVYDWEESRPDIPAFWDCFYYVAAPSLRIHKKADPATVTRQCLEFARQVASASALEHFDITCHFVLWCLGRNTIDPFYGKMLMTLNLETR